MHNLFNYIIDLLQRFGMAWHAVPCRGIARHVVLIAQFLLIQEIDVLELKKSTLLMEQPIDAC